MPSLPCGVHWGKPNAREVPSSTKIPRKQHPAKILFSFFSHIKTSPFLVPLWAHSPYHSVGHSHPTSPNLFAGNCQTADGAVPNASVQITGGLGKMFPPVPGHLRCCLIIFFSVFLLSGSISSSRLEAAWPERGPEAAQHFPRHSNIRGRAKRMETLETWLSITPVGYPTSTMSPDVIRYNGVVERGPSLMCS